MHRKNHWILAQVVEFMLIKERVKFIIQVIYLGYNVISKSFEANLLFILFLFPFFFFWKSLSEAISVASKVPKKKKKDKRERKKKPAH